MRLYSTDDEGRVITVEMAGCVIVAAYVPNSGEGLARLGERTEGWEPALARHLGPAAHVLPTGYDSAAAALALPGAHESLAALKELGVAVLHSVDATALGPEVGRGRATVPPAFALADRGRRRCAPGRAP